MARMSIQLIGTSAGMPSPERGMPCIFLSWKGFPFLWDMGEGSQRELMRHRLGFGSIRHVFITHLHMDHFLGLYGYLETMRLLGLYGYPEGHASPIEKGDTFSIFAPKGFEDIMSRKSDFIKVKTIKEGVLLKGGDFTISAFKVKHRQDSYGFLFEENERVRFNEKKAKSMGLKGPMFTEIMEKGKLIINGKTIRLAEVTYKTKGLKVLYTGDTAPFPGMEKLAKGCDAIIHECTFSAGMEKDAHRKGHSTSLDAAALAAKSGAKTLILTHISPRYAKGREKALEDEARKRFKGNVLLGYDGLKVEL
jgi:ribonuclease Z